ncbi:signal peptidase II [Solicola sp. PLA-1-18]|uniref:signal peptidase II n=1 Tax=Solicola sp. PLA-1-18 TaxID=3380532 RepID=UPI003B780C54
MNALLERVMRPGRTTTLGLLDLRLEYNTGIAFGLGGDLAPSVVTTVTGIVTVAVAVVAFRAVPHLAPLGRIGLTGLVSGGAANVLDRAGDGAVSDYLHTGWFPTFNLADAFIAVGAILILLDSLLGGNQHR